MACIELSINQTFRYSTMVNCHALQINIVVEDDILSGMMTQKHGLSKYRRRVVRELPISPHHVANYNNTTCMCKTIQKSGKISKYI